MDAGFRWVDGERLIRFGRGALAEAPALLAERGFDRYVLLASERTLDRAPALASAAVAVSRVPAGRVSDAATAVRGAVAGRAVVALGGGRVIDSAKAIAAIDRVPCAALPTTLSGAELSRRHRFPPGFEGTPPVRPSLVISDPALMASQPLPELAASAMNALGHALEALYVPSANPVAEMAALRGAALIARGLVHEQPGRDELALGSLLAGYALGATGLAVHHVICQTLVAIAGTPHAKTNAVMLPHCVALMAARARAQIGRFAAALGAGAADPAAAAELVAPLAARAGVTTLRQLGVSADILPKVAEAAVSRAELRATPGALEKPDLLELLRAAL